MECCNVYTPQEEYLQKLAAGNCDIRKGRERIYRIIDSYNGTKPAIDVERGLYFTESMKQTEGEMLVLRWAKALKHIAEKITVYIDDDTLIVGRGVNLRVGEGFVVEPGSASLAATAWCIQNWTVILWM